MLWKLTLVNCKSTNVMLITSGIHHLKKDQEYAVESLGINIDQKLVLCHFQSFLKSCLSSTWEGMQFRMFFFLLELNIFSQES